MPPRQSTRLRKAKEEREKAEQLATPVKSTPVKASPSSSSPPPKNKAKITPPAKKAPSVAKSAPLSTPNPRSRRQPSLPPPPPAKRKKTSKVDLVSPTKSSAFSLADFVKSLPSNTVSASHESSSTPPRPVTQWNLNMQCAEFNPSIPLELYRIGGHHDDDSLLDVDTLPSELTNIRRTASSNRMIRRFLTRPTELQVFAIHPPDTPSAQFTHLLTYHPSYTMELESVTPLPHPSPSFYLLPFGSLRSPLESRPEFGGSLELFIHLHPEQSPPFLLICDHHHEHS